MEDLVTIRYTTPDGDALEILHREAGSGYWLVRRRRPTFFGLRLVSQTWFNDRARAEAYARECAATTVLAGSRGIRFRK